MIFTLINSVDEACRGRIYTQDYIGLIKKKEEEAGERRRRRRRRRRDTYCDGGEQGFIWDYLTA